MSNVIDRIHETIHRLSGGHGLEEELRKKATLVCLLADDNYCKDGTQVWREIQGLRSILERMKRDD